MLVESHHQSTKSAASPLPPRSGEIFVAVGAAAHCRCAYSRHPRCWHKNQSLPGGVQQNAESIACRTPLGCNMIEQSIPWVLQTHGYKHCTTPWCGNFVLVRMALRDGGWRLEKREGSASGAQRRNYKMSSIGVSPDF